MQRRNLVVEVLTLLVEAPATAAHDFLRHGFVDAALCSEVSRQFEEIERAPRVTVSGRHDQAERRFVRGDIGTGTALRVGKRPVEDAAQVVRLQHPEHIDPSA